MIVVLIWGCSDTIIGVSIAEACQKYLNLSVLVSFQLNDGTNDLPELYTAAKALVNREAKMSNFVIKARQIIEERFGDSHLTLEKIADELNVSSVYLSRIFKQEAGQSFIGMLTHARITVAIRMLAGTNLTINEIAEQTGYDTQHYFSTSFKKVVGTTKLLPKKYHWRVSL